MSDSRINPYSPQAITGDDDRTKLTFDAIIEERDYFELLPRRDYESLLYAVMLGLLTLTTVLLFTASLTGIAMRGWDDVLIPVIVLNILLASGTVFAFRFTRPIRRMRQTLKRHPDLLGIARGQITESGIAFHDSTRQLWFGPQFLLTSSTSNAGIRIQIDKDPSRYLALTPRMFDQYNEQVASRLQNSWRQSSATATDETHPAGLDLWQSLSPMPDDAVSFSGTVTLQNPMRTPQLRQSAMIEFVVSLGAVLGAIIGGDPFGIGDGLVLVAIGVLGLAFSGYQWKQYFFDTVTQTWNQRGWISPRELAVVRGCVGVRFPLTDIVQVSNNGTLISLACRSSDEYYLHLDHFHNSDQWVQLVGVLPISSTPINHP